MLSLSLKKKKNPKRRVLFKNAPKGVTQVSKEKIDVHGKLNNISTVTTKQKTVSRPGENMRKDPEKMIQEEALAVQKGKKKKRKKKLSFHL